LIDVDLLSNFPYKILVEMLEFVFIVDVE